VFFLTCDGCAVLIERDGPVAPPGSRSAGESARRNRGLQASDVVDDDGIATVSRARRTVPCDNELRGYGVSSGTVTGRVRVLRSARAIDICSGEIVVIPAIERPSRRSFPLVGINREMGGLLSHAAISRGIRIARRRQRARCHATPPGRGIGSARWETGRIRVLERAGDASRRPASVGPVGRPLQRHPAGQRLPVPVEARRDDHAERRRR